jgi:hypothetical protein
MGCGTSRGTFQKPPSHFHIFFLKNVAKACEESTTQIDFSIKGFWTNCQVNAFCKKDEKHFYCCNKTLFLYILAYQRCKESAFSRNCQIALSSDHIKKLFGIIIQET